jgi:uncharacterized membrane protein
MKIYFLTLAALLSLDVLWLKFVATSFYQHHLGYIFNEKFVLWPAALFYVIYAFGVMFFVINPGLEAKSLWVILYRGALLSLITYAAYDLTNQATIAKWPLVVTAVDLLWGIILTAVASVIVYLIVK